MEFNSFNKKIVIVLSTFVLLLTSFNTVHAKGEGGFFSRARKSDESKNTTFSRDPRTELHSNRLGQSFNVFYRRLSVVITKIQTRLDNLKADGKDITASQAKLDEAKVKLEAAKVAGEEAVKLFNSISKEKYEEQKTVVLSARDKAIEARKLFLEAHKLLKETVRLAKGLEK